MNSYQIQINDLSRQLRDPLRFSRKREWVHECLTLLNYLPPSLNHLWIRLNEAIQEGCDNLDDCVEITSVYCIQAIHMLRRT